jgi:hypothetical protein
VGIGAVNIAVADAGPLIHLTEIGCLPLLRVFDILHIPEAVWWETVGHGRVEQGDVLGLGTVQRHTLFVLYLILRFNFNITAPFRQVYSRTMADSGTKKRGSPQWRTF